MEIITLKQFNISEKTAVAIGKFDGIHLGHMMLLEKILSKKKDGFKTCVFTFNPSAARFFGRGDIKEVTTYKEKRVIFEKLGIDILVEFPLDAQTAAITAEEFIDEIVIRQLDAGYIVAGDDLSFGYKGAGNAHLLREKSLDEKGKHIYEVEIIDKLQYEGREISSTYLREEIMAGHMDIVANLLGHPYSFSGKVMPGYKLGRKLGFPTMNQYPDEEKILPPLGVYYSMVYFEGGSYPGLTNIGIRPTVTQKDTGVEEKINNESMNSESISVETYLYDFDKDMYGKEITTELIMFKRPEQKFESLEKLKEQISLDLSQGRKYFAIG